MGTARLFTCKGWLDLNQHHTPVFRQPKQLPLFVAPLRLAAFNSATRPFFTENRIQRAGLDTCFHRGPSGFSESQYFRKRWPRIALLAGIIHVSFHAAAGFCFRVVKIKTENGRVFTCITCQVRFWVRLTPSFRIRSRARFQVWQIGWRVNSLLFLKPTLESVEQGDYSLPTGEIKNQNYELDQAPPVCYRFLYAI